jgi:hypothetical protein
MALIECFECGNQVSDAAAICPKCGVAIASNIKQEEVVVEEESKGSIKGFLEAKLSMQILFTVGMWISAGITISAYQNNNDATLTPLLWVIGIASLVRGSKNYLELKKKHEENLSAVDTIALGVSKAKSPTAHAHGNFLGFMLVAGFWFVMYSLTAAFSIILAPLMTLFVAYKAVKSSK